MTLKRNIFKNILSDLEKKMVFLVGPRQVGKTWLSKEIMKMYTNPVYLNFDNSEHAEVINNKSWLPDADLIVFDEIHKMPSWKNYLKGVYDTKPESLHILVTGSARLGTLKKLGDSLAGRFFVHHLLPFTLAETKDSILKNPSKLLFERGGFPEPLLAKDATEADRWRLLYTDSLLGRDILEFQDIDKVNAVRRIYELLKKKVGSPVSYSSIARDVGISPVTAKKYIEILEALYIVFTIRPYTKKISRSILKEPKIYFFDYGVINHTGARFENFTALSLYKDALLKTDSLGKKHNLGFLRTKEGKETDFALFNEESNLTEIIEAKISDSSVSKNLEYFSEKYKVKGTQLVYRLGLERVSDKGVYVKDAEKYLSGLEKIVSKPSFTNL